MIIQASVILNVSLASSTARTRSRRSGKGNAKALTNGRLLPNTVPTLSPKELVNGPCSRRPHSLHDISRIIGKVCPSNLALENAFFNTATGFANERRSSIYLILACGVSIQHRIAQPIGIWVMSRVMSKLSHVRNSSTGFTNFTDYVFGICETCVICGSFFRVSATLTWLWVMGIGRSVIVFVGSPTVSY